MLLAGIWTTNGIPKRKTLSVFIRNSGRLVIFVAVQLVYPPHACTQDFTGTVMYAYIYAPWDDLKKCCWDRLIVLADTG